MATVGGIRLRCISFHNVTDLQLYFVLEIAGENRIFENNSILPLLKLKLNCDQEPLKDEKYIIQESHISRQW